MPLFFLAVPLTPLRVGKLDNAHTPVRQASYLMVPHARVTVTTCPTVAMVRTLFHVRLTAGAMLLNYSCHV